jgi:mono/diheme cytochrome c family protein
MRSLTTRLLRLFVWMAATAAAAGWLLPSVLATPPRGQGGPAGAGRAARGDSARETVLPGAAAAFFETRIRPLLADNCFKCHTGNKPKGKLRLDSRAGLLQGGERGPALVPGRPDQSLLLRAVRQSDDDLKMPPSKKLPRRQIEDLEAWIKGGAHWPASDHDRPIATSVQAEFHPSAEDRNYWAFRPIQRPPVPSIRHGEYPANPIDAFLLARLEARGLRPNPPAGRRELIRRAYFDLIGLPPAPEEIAAFAKDMRPDAWDRLIDRLLASPHYGERWGRHWLDLVRYAQTNGYERDGEKPYAWRYRDYVIRSFNQDKAYDQFIREQLAGDELQPRTDDGIIATGFYRLGVWDDEPDDARQAAYDELDDILTAVGQTFLGLTINCARCHDHKFDPISQKDYYRLLSFVQNIRGYEDPKKLDLHSAAFAALGPADQLERWRRDMEEKNNKLKGLVQSTHNAGQKQEAERRLEWLASQPPPFGWALCVREKGTTPPETHVLVRGNASTPGETVDARFPEVFGTSVSFQPRPSPNRESTGRRRLLADWIASPRNPLTARVLVNRVWQHHFGRGLVPTPNDFGKAGLSPTHPELLDWLAAEFIDGGWRMKHLHRLLMTSRAYRLSSRTDNLEARTLDEGNDLYWRQNLRRLEVEPLRDTILAVSGQLNPEMGGRGVFPRLSREVIAGESRPGLDWEISTPEQEARRSVYLFIKRTLLVPMLETFDYSNTAQPVGQRGVTTVAPQALLLLNSDFLHHSAAHLAARLVNEAGNEPAAQVRRAYQLALGRSPTHRELQIALDYLAGQAETLGSVQPGLTVSPLVPTALHESYLKQLQPEDCLRGPRAGWLYRRGHWAAPYEGIQIVDVPRGPCTLWQGLTFADGVIEGTLQLHPSSELAGLLFRARPRGQECSGYDITLDPRNHRLFLRRQDGETSAELADVPLNIPWDREHRLMIAAERSRIRVWLDGRQAPILDVVDPQPLTQPGCLGLRTWGAPLTVHDLTISSSGKRIRIDPATTLSAGEARREALESFCLIVLNLNEFAYVD